MDSLRGISCFVAAVEEGSIAAAGRRLGISAAAASQNIARLETILGARLLRRTTRHLALTESGGAYYERVRSLVNDLENAHMAVLGVHGQPQGRLRIASSVTFGRHILSSIVPDFLARYDKVSTELIIADRVVDHIKEDIDVSIRYGEQLAPGLAARLIGKVPFVYCASPAYIKRAGTPATPEELQDHICLVFRSPADNQLLDWRFWKDGHPFKPKFGATLIANDGSTLTDLALSGAGIARVPHYVAAPLLENRSLVSVLPSNKEEARRGKAKKTTTDCLEYFACFQTRSDATPKVRSFVEMLLEGTARHPSFSLL